MTYSLKKTARENKKPINQLDFSKIPIWSKKQIEDGFALIRDTKFLDCSNVNKAKRRIPWLYVENGCFLKSSLAKDLLKEYNYPKISKFFIFGSFNFDTKWTKKGFVTYKDHNALCVKTENEVYLLDPSVCYEKALSLNEWISKLLENSQIKDVEGSICSSLCFSHNSNCDELNEKNEVGIRSGLPYSKLFFTVEFLSKEFKQIIDLGHNPKHLL